MCLYNYVKYSAVGPGVSGELYVFCNVYAHVTIINDILNYLRSKLYHLQR